MFIRVLSFAVSTVGRARRKVYILPLIIIIGSIFSVYLALGTQNAARVESDHKVQSATSESVGVSRLQRLAKSQSEQTTVAVENSQQQPSTNQIVTDNTTKPNIETTAKILVLRSNPLDNSKLSAEMPLASSQKLQSWTAKSSNEQILALITPDTNSNVLRVEAPSSLPKAKYSVTVQLMSSTNQVLSSQLIELSVE